MGNPLIEAHARRVGARRRPAVRLRADAKRDLAAIGPVRRLDCTRPFADVRTEILHRLTGRTHGPRAAERNTLKF